ncbi:DUF2834 domain-containing protein [Marinomonas sp. THO17]|uniref:DUF2834 domain-containing protein n=1 Tax=Marinomonas sp. THO17 TaxID=3149048 RepID=UPI00336C000B
MVAFFYLLMCILGTVFPYWAFLPWFFENGLNIHLLLTEASPAIAAFAWLDVVISALVLLVFIWVDGKRNKMSMLWLPTLGTLVVGVSLGLPLFLLMREWQMSSSER